MKVSKFSNGLFAGQVVIFGYGLYKMGVSLLGRAVEPVVKIDPKLVDNTLNYMDKDRRSEELREATRNYIW